MVELGDVGPSGLAVVVDEIGCPVGGEPSPCESVGRNGGGESVASCRRIDLGDPVAAGVVAVSPLSALQLGERGAVVVVVAGSGLQGLATYLFRSVSGRSAKRSSANRCAVRSVP